MSVEARCPNAECGVVVTLQDQLRGRKVRCPKCGATIQVPAGPEHAVRETPEQPPSVPAAPESVASARKCSECGKSLEEGVSFCPHCGAHVGKGPAPAKAHEKAPKKKPALKSSPRRLRPGAPKGLAIGAAIGVVLVAGGVAALILLKGGRLGGGEPAPAIGEQEASKQQVSPPPTAKGTSQTPSSEKVRDKPKPRFEKEDERLAAQEARVRENVTAYFEKLLQAAADRTRSTQEQMAAKWADLCQWCRQNGLSTEADMCWFRAVAMQPKASETNALLGRTAAFGDLPVEPDQKAFLDSLSPRLRVVNRHPAMERLRVGLEGGDLRALAPSESWETQVGPGNVVLRMEISQGTTVATGRVRLQTALGKQLTVSVLGDELPPSVTFGYVRALHNCLGTWNRYKDPKHALSDDQVQKLGWQRVASGWQVVAKGGDATRFTTGPGGALVCVAFSRSAGKAGEQFSSEAQLSSEPEGILDIAPGRETYKVVGRLQIPDWKLRAITLVGTQDRPVVIAGIPGREWGRVRSGNVEDSGQIVALGMAEIEGEEDIAVSYQVEDEPIESVVRILAAASPKYGRSAELKRVRRSHEELLDRARELEARGGLLGSWHSDLWVGARIRQVCETQWQRGRLEEQAHQLPLFARRLAILQVPNPGEHTYLEWPRLREALAPIVSDAVEEVSDPEVRRELVPLMSERQAVAFLREELQAGGPQRFLNALENAWLAGGGELVAFLAEMADSGNLGVRAAICPVLGDIGTVQALEPCRGATLDLPIQGARLAALAGAGDEKTIASLEQTLGNDLPQVRAAFLPALLRMRSPTVLPVLSKVLDLYKDPKDRAQIAGYLGTIGGHAAAFLLARLIEEDGQPYAEALGQFQPGETVLLIGPLGKVLREGSTGSAQAGLALGLTRSDLAAPVLEAAAEKRMPHAVVGLAVLGSAPAIERAAQSAELVGTEQLDVIWKYWQKDASGGQNGTAQWRPDVDRQAAAGFLQAVLRDAKNSDTKIRAADLLIVAGERPEPAGLLSVASRPLLVAQAAEGTAPAGTTGPPTGVMRRMPGQGLPNAPQLGGGLPGPYAGGEGAPGMPGRPGFAPPTAAAAPPTADQALALQRKALELLESVAGPGLVPELRKLAEESKVMEVRTGALRLLGQKGGMESLNYLEELAAPPSGRYADLKDMLERARMRAAALCGLAGAGQPAIVSYLHQAWFEQAPQTQDFERPGATKDYEAAVAERQLTLRQGVCEAVLALPSGQTLSGIAQDKAQADELAEQFRSLALAGARAIKARPNLQGHTSLAIRALGRGGRLSSDAWEAMELLAGEEVTLPMLRPAVAEALVDMANDRAATLLMGMRARMEEQPVLKSQWDQICVRLAARGLSSDYAIIIKTLDTLSEEVVGSIVGIMAQRPDAPPDSYYELLARVAARPILSEYVPPAESYNSALGGVAQPEQRPAGRPLGPGGPGSGLPIPGARMGALGRIPEGTRTMRERAATPKKPSSLRSAALPPDRWLEDIGFWSQCLTLLVKAPDHVVSRLLLSADVGLNAHELFGPWTVLVASQRGGNLNLVDELKKRFEANVSVEDRCAVVSIARKVGSEEANQLLAGILLAAPEEKVKPPAQGPGRPAEETPPAVPPIRPGVGIRPGMILPGGGWLGPPESAGATPPGQPWMPREAPPRPKQRVTGEDEEKVLMVCVARALGSLGDSGTLRKAVNYSYSKESKLTFDYPGQVVQGSLQGMAYLPREKDPIASLQRLNRLLLDPGINRVCAEAMLEAWRLSRSDARRSTEREGT